MHSLMLRAERFDGVDCAKVVDPATNRPWSNVSTPDWRGALCDPSKKPGLALLGGLHACVRGMPLWDCYGGANPSNATKEKCAKTTPLGSGAIIAALRTMALERVRELGLDKTFSQMILTRSDYVYLRAPAHPRVMRADANAADAATIYIPSGQDWGGYNDRYSAGSTPAMLRAMSWGQGLVCDSNRTAHDMTSRMGPEMSLKRHLDYVGVFPRRFESSMFTVRARQSPDETPTQRFVVVDAERVEAYAEAFDDDDDDAARDASGPAPAEPDVDVDAGTRGGEDERGEEGEAGNANPDGKKTRGGADASAETAAREL